MTNLEIAANAVTTLSIFLAGRGSIHTWWTGMVGSALFAVLFFGTQLYADVTLQFFFIATSVLGWFKWRQGAGGAVLPITRITGQNVLIYAVGGGVVGLIYGLLLHNFTNAYAPFWDSAILVISVVAQLLLVRRKLENWLFWLVVNSIAVPLFVSRGLYLTSGLYAAYWVHAALSWVLWRRQFLAAEGEAK
jgi:nicotinamide mononucleotide transporter